MSLSWILLLTCMAQALLVIIWILLSMNCAWKYRAKQSAGSISRSQGTGDISGDRYLFFLRMSKR